jgi:lysophospholipase L1-like esterase
VLLGDSLIAGLGVRGRSYGQLVGEHLGARQILGWGRSGFTVETALRRLPALRERAPDLAVVGVGGSEGLVHAGARVQQLLQRVAPPTWQGVDGLEPPVWNAAPGAGRTRQRLETAAKLALKHASIGLGHVHRRLPPDDYVRDLHQLLAGLAEIGCLTVVVAVHVPDRLRWPGSARSCREYATLTRRVVAAHQHVLFVESAPLLHRWADYTDDRAHLSASGHGKIADAVVGLLAERTPVSS